MADQTITDPVTGNASHAAGTISVTIPAQSLTIQIPAQTLKVALPASTDPVTGQVTIDITTLAAQVAALIPSTGAPPPNSAIDSAGNVWGINTAGKITYQPYNATTKTLGPVQVDTSTGAVINVSYYESSGLIYQENASKSWWSTPGWPAGSSLPVWTATTNPYA